MLRKRIAVLAAIGLTAATSLFATELDEIISRAKEKSPSYLNTVLSYQNGLINVQKLDKNDDQVVVTVTGNDIEGGLTKAPNEAFMTIAKDAEDHAVIEVMPSVTVELPNDGKTTITSGLKISANSDGGVQRLYGQAGVSHTIDFISYNSKSDDLNYASTKYSTELTFKRADLSFEKTVISSLNSLLTAEKSMEKARDTIEKQKQSLANMEALGTYSTTSPTYIKTQNTLKTLEESMTAAEQQMEDARYNYKILTGLDWDYLDPLPIPVLKLTTYDNGNTSVYLSSLTAESAYDRYASALAAYNPNALVLNGNLKADGDLENSSNYTISGSASYVGKNWSGSVAPSATFNNAANDTAVYSLMASAKYAEDNWYLQAAPSVTVKVTSDTKVTPSLTISGKWTNKTSATSEDQELQTLLNTAQSRQNDYISSLTSYTQESQNLAVRIMNWNYKKAQQEANLDYLNMLLDNQKALYEIGLASESDVKDAELDISQAMYDWNMMLLEGLSLQRDLEIFAL